MAAELIIAPEASHDLAEAYAWYEGRRVGLGEEFLSWCALPPHQDISRHGRRHGSYLIVDSLKAASS
ncbi:MAG TPA: hypothetical protein VNP04_06975 [Alphaproteobacteria bacterium]|nr:hypothetical protein [Alphaproteobacteria bacterium]